MRTNNSPHDRTRAGYGKIAFSETAFCGVKALVVGDVMLDRYISGRASRVSPEAPVPIIDIEREWTAPGGAGNVAASLVGLGCEVTLAGCVGADEKGERLVAKLREAGVAELRLVHAANTRTICKTRIVSADQQMMRLDENGNQLAFACEADRLAETVLPVVAAQDVVVLADYDRGILTEALLRRIIDACLKAGIPCIADPKRSDFQVYAGATILCPNVLETERATGRRLWNRDDISATAEKLRADLELQYMLITRGPDGMTLATREATTHIVACPCAVRDVSGAGDTVAAVIAAGLATSLEIEDVCGLAALAASLAITKEGVYVVSAQELAAAAHGHSPKIRDWDTAKTYVERARSNGRRVVFTNGCFDILHAGHLSCLEQARELGDILVVGLNSDISVQLNKGTTRPIIGQANRAALLAGLECVDAVVLFDELTPENLVRLLAPDVLAKGGDYEPDAIAGADFVRARGGTVAIIPLIDGLSTTGILQTRERLKSLVGGPGSGFREAAGDLPRKAR